jgi:hypothetical protein
VSAYKSSSSVSKPRVRQNRHKQGLNQTIEKLSADFRLKAFLEDGEETLPEGRKIYYEDIPFSEIDIDQYDNSMTVLEHELFRKAGEVFRVYEP